MTTEDRDELARVVKERGAQTVIAVDGALGSGKTVLATWLAGQLGGTVLSIDDYANRDIPGYVTSLDVTRLRRDVESASRPLVLEGICLRQVCDRLSVTTSVHVYVIHVDRHGVWEEGEIYESPDTSEALAGLSPLRQEVASYHPESSPHQMADIVFVRRDA